MNHHLYKQWAPVGLHAMKDFSPLDHFRDEIIGAYQGIRNPLEQLAGHLSGVNHLHHH